MSVAKMTSYRRFMAFVVVPLIVGGCTSHRGAQVNYHDPNMDFSLIQKVAVLPFENLSNMGKADDRVRDVFMTMLQATGAVYVLPPGEVARGISRVGIPNPMAPAAEDVVRLAENLEVDVVITGTVLEYGEVRSATATANAIAVSVQMIEGQSGSVVWSASTTKGGIGAGDRLLGGGGEPMNVVTAKAVDQLLELLFD